MDALLQVLASREPSDEKERMDRLIDAGELFFDELNDLAHNGVKHLAAEQIPRNRELPVD